jgi:hypothetical protein
LSQPESPSSTQPTRVRAITRPVRTTAAARDPRQQSGLGPFLAGYHSRQLAAWDVLFLFIPGIAACLGPLGYGLWRAEYALTRYGPVAAEYWSRPWYNLAIVATAIFLILGGYRLSLSLTCVKIYQKGFSIRAGIKGARSFSWDDFEGLISSTTQEHFFGIPVRNTYRARLILGSGKTIKLPGSLKHFPELISRIKANLYPRLMPKLQSKYQSGAWLNFGPITIQLQGLRLDGQTVSWQQVKHIDVREGALMIEFIERANRKIPVDQIPNLELVLQLIDQGIED